MARSWRRDLQHTDSDPLAHRNLAGNRNYGALSNTHGHGDTGYHRHTPGSEPDGRLSHAAFANCSACLPDSRSDRHAQRNNCTSAHHTRRVADERKGRSHAGAERHRHRIPDRGNGKPGGRGRNGA